MTEIRTAANQDPRSIVELMPDGTVIIDEIHPGSHGREDGLGRSYGQVDPGLVGVEKPRQRVASSDAFVIGGGVLVQSQNEFGVGVS